MVPISGRTLGPFRCALQTLELPIDAGTRFGFCLLSVLGSLVRCSAVRCGLPKALLPKGNGRDVLLMGIAKRAGACACACSMWCVCVCVCVCARTCVAAGLALACALGTPCRGVLCCGNPLPVNKITQKKIKSRMLDSIENNRNKIMHHFCGSTATNCKQSSRARAKETQRDTALCIHKSLPPTKETCDGHLLGNGLWDGFGFGFGCWYWGCWWNKLKWNTKFDLSWINVP